jgi:hypothetical protein
MNRRSGRSVTLVLATCAVVGVLHRQTAADAQIIRDMRSVVATHPTLSDSLREIIDSMVVEELTPYPDLGPDRRAVGAEHFRVYLSTALPGAQAGAMTDPRGDELTALQVRIALRSFALVPPGSEELRAKARQIAQWIIAAVPALVQKCGPDFDAATRASISRSTVEALNLDLGNLGNYFLHHMPALQPTAPTTESDCAQQLMDHCNFDDAKRTFQSHLTREVPDALPERIKAMNFEARHGLVAWDLAGKVKNYWRTRIIDRRYVLEISPESGIAELFTLYRRASEARRSSGEEADGVNAITWSEAVRRLLDGSGIRIEDDGRIVLPAAFLRN